MNEIYIIRVNQKYQLRIYYIIRYMLVIILMQVLNTEYLFLLLLGSYTRYTVEFLSFIEVPVHNTCLKCPPLESLHAWALLITDCRTPERPQGGCE
jgi:hypothetical protein